MYSQKLKHKAKVLYFKGYTPRSIARELKIADAQIISSWIYRGDWKYEKKSEASTTYKLYFSGIKLSKIASSLGLPIGICEEHIRLLSPFTIKGELPNRFNPEKEEDEFSELFESWDEPAKKTPQDKILTFLRQYPRSYQYEVCEATGLAKATVSKYINGLVLDKQVTKDFEGKYHLTVRGKKRVKN